MTDPRIAALAEALAQHVPDCYEEHPECGHITMYDCAAAILAALPPDWCGHGTLVEEVIREQKAEIARLRPIEEAARALADDLEGGLFTTALRDLPALRAALEE